MTISPLTTDERAEASLLQPGRAAPPGEAVQPDPTAAPPPFSRVPWHQQFRRPQIVQALEAVQDLIAVSLCLGLFCVMALQLKGIFASLLSKPQFHAITADILFILILVELFRLLIIYLQEQRVSIGVSVEIAIVSVLREVIVNGVLETEWQQMLAVCLFLATAALLMVVRVWLPPTFAGVDPEARVSARMRLHHEGE
ncbi:phosphate-starvation-inducible PsiE family protein [Synechococcus sp. CBW1004]|uniref:phosphate-starvation-inducible PsiE family protein n=1 Tax=Synechococcus sp. CBW1004 TaxID=1353136 RepID=UPI0018CE7D93|nr:phosphate-starvation-inducible PsiE family protein [Synechococcus sp. CBW1004]